MHRLLIITNTLASFGGGEKWALEVGTHMRRTFEIKYLNPVSKNSIERMSIKRIKSTYGLKESQIVNVKCIGKKSKAFETEDFILMIPTAKGLIDLSNAIKNSDVVYILSMNPVILSYAIFQASLYKKKLIVGIHIPLVEKILEDKKTNRIYKTGYKYLLRRVKYFHVINRTDRETIKKHFPKANIYLIPNFVDIPKEKPKINNKKFVVMFASRMQTYQKGIDLLEKIVDDVADKQKNIIFHIIGSGGDGEQIAKRLEKKHKDNVKYLGFISEKKLNEEYSNANLFISTSRFESFGLSVAEAQAHGLPVVAFDVKGLSDVLIKRHQSRIIEPFEITEFADTICNHYASWINDIGAYYGEKRMIYDIVRCRYNKDKIVRHLIDMIL